MKSRILRYTITMLTALSISLPLAAQAAESANKGPTRYAVINLGSLGGSQGAAFGINNKGWVIGDANLPGDQNEHGFLWRDGVKTDLGTFGGLNSTAPGPVNDKGVIAGGAQTPEIDPLGEQWVYFCTSNPCQGGDLITVPYRWQDGVKTALPTLGGNQGIAEGINNRGQIVGLAENSTHDPSCIAPQVLDFEAVIWGPKEGEIQELPPFPGDRVGVAATINDHGQVVGCSGTCGSGISTTDCVHATLWQNGSVTDLGGFGGAMNNLAAAINNRGEVAGGSDLPGDTTGHAFLWTVDSGLQDLGTLSGDFSSGSSGMNDKGQVVGQSCNSDFSVCRAFLWQNGVMTDLNTLIPPNSPLFLFYGATINNRGEIVGEAVDQSGNAPAFLAIPCDEEHGDIKECEDTVEQPTDAIERPQITLPENIREQLRQRRGFKLFSPGVTAEQHDNQSNSNLVKNLDTLEGTSTAAECSGDPSSGIADKRPADPDADQPPYGPRCEVSFSNYKLTGQCLNGISGTCFRKYDPTHCPPGQRPLSLGRGFCRPHRQVVFDWGRVCNVY